jgi:hypothetical protein
MSRETIEVVPFEGTTADKCRCLGLVVGDTILGREAGPRGCWHEARLTLLWVGQEEAMWREQTRTDEEPEWSEPREAGDWTLYAREWKKIPTPTSQGAPK